MRPSRNIVFQIAETHDAAGVQSLLTRLMDYLGIAEYELAKRTGVTPATIYGILSSKSDRQVRRSTLRRIAVGVGFTITFKGNKIHMAEVNQQPRVHSPLTQLAEDIANIIVTSGWEEISSSEADRIKKVVKALCTKTE